jgi:Ca2+-binding EF-hand superfamily protein
MTEVHAIKSLRDRLLSRFGKNGLRALGRYMLLDRPAAASDAQQMSPAELRSSLREFGLILSDEDYAAIVLAVDPKQTGLIAPADFFRLLRGSIRPRQITVIKAAFRRLDHDGTGIISLDTLREYYQTGRHPAVLIHHLSQEQAADKFLSNWTGETNPDLVVTEEEFFNYYAGVSYRFRDDTEFELLLTRSWSLDRPTNLSRQEELLRQTQTAISKFGTAHPLYQTSAKLYGKDLEQAFKPETRYNKAGAFTKKEPPPSPSCSLNTSMTRNRYY